MTETTDGTIGRRIRVLPEQWERIEKAAAGTLFTPNQLLVELAMEALDRREWPRTEAEIALLRSAMFAAQAIVLEMEKAGREDEIGEISRFISQVAPEWPEPASESAGCGEEASTVPLPGGPLPRFRRGKTLRDRPAAVRVAGHPLGRSSASRSTARTGSA